MTSVLWLAFVLLFELVGLLAVTSLSRVVQEHSTSAHGNTAAIAASVCAAKVKELIHEDQPNHLIVSSDCRVGTQC